MGKYGFAAMVWVVLGIVLSYMATPQGSCAVPRTAGAELGSVIWITILGALLLLDMLSWRKKAWA